MDPQETWQDIVDAAADIDIEDIDPKASLDPDDLVKLVENIRNLNEWLRKGGVPPRYAQSNKELAIEMQNMELRNEHPWNRRRYR